MILRTRLAALLLSPASCLAAGAGGSAPEGFGQGTPSWVCGVAIAIALVFLAIPVTAILFKSGGEEA